MRYYSDYLKKLYDSEKDLLAAEKAAKDAELKKKQAEEAKAANKATRAKEVETALKAATEAQNKANKLLKEFIKDYGYFHTTYSTDEDTNSLFSFSDLLSSFLE